MLEIKKSVIIPFSPEAMYNLVSDIKNYPHYLPWCTSSEVKEIEKNIVTGRVDIEYLKIKTHFTTQNINTPPHKIIMHFLDGPFKAFSGEWNFIPLGENGCKVNFNLTYQFANIILERMIGPVFSYISKNIVECFILEAKKRYGTN